MKPSFFQSRTGLAVFIGLTSALVLSALFLGGSHSGNLKEESEEKILISTGTVREGQTLASVLEEKKLPSPIIYRIQSTLGKSFNLRRMKPGHQFDVVTSTDGVFKRFHYHTSSIHSYTVTRSSSGVYDCQETSQKTVWMEKKVDVKVTDNIYTDLLRAGYNETFVANLVGELADNIFAWRIDFFTEQRTGDELAVLLEQEFALGSDQPLSGRRLRILAAYYEGKSTKRKENFAFRYLAQGQKKADYFDEKGKAVRKAFLRAPFTHGGFRISSHYNPKRFHPIKRVYRPHHGIDYAAATGTPVAAVGRGTVILAGWNGGYGKCVEIRHSSKYVSRYGHLSRIAVKKGQIVEQAQYIGRVGSTGLSTGPHLHFEMIDNGRRRNFLRMNFPSAKSVSAKNLEEFKKVKNRHFDRLMEKAVIVSSTDRS